MKQINNNNVNYYQDKQNTHWLYDSRETDNYTDQNSGSLNNAINMYHENKYGYYLNALHSSSATPKYSTLSKNSYSHKASNLKILHMKTKPVLEPSLVTKDNEETCNNILENRYINVVNKVRHSPPSNKEWINSTYVYSKTSINTPILNKMLARLIRSYFNLYSNKLRKKIRKHGSRRFEIRKSRRLMNRIFIGKPELKHSNDNVLITVYIYNAEKKFLINKIKNVPAPYKINSINNVNVHTNNKAVTNERQAKTPYINITKKASVNIKYKLDGYKNKYLLLKKFRTKKHFNTNKYDRYFFMGYTKKFLRKEIISNYYKQILVFNKQKFEKRYVIHLANNIAKLYRKKIRFNFISLKHIYLDSQIFSISLVTKLKRLARMKKSFLIGLKRFFNMFKIPRISSILTYNEIFNRQTLNQTIANSNILAIPNYADIIKSNIVNKDIIDNTLKYEDYISNTDIRNFYNTAILRYISTFNKAFNSVKYKIINGIRLEIAGRFTKRSSAARSVFKIRNKGSIKNKDSSYKGLPAVLLKGYAKSNLQFNKLSSKVRGGSFGIKSSLSGA